MRLSLAFKGDARKSTSCLFYSPFGICWKRSQPVLRPVDKSRLPETDIPQKYEILWQAYPGPVLLPILSLRFLTVYMVIMELFLILTAFGDGHEPGKPLFPRGAGVLFPPDDLREINNNQ